LVSRIGEKSCMNDDIGIKFIGKALSLAFSFQYKFKTANILTDSSFAHLS